MALLLLELLRRPRMENIQPVPYNMELRRPEQIPQMGVHGGIQNTDFLGRNKLRNRIRFPDIQGMVVVIIIGGNKIIFSLPFADAGVGTMPCNRKFIMILMHPAHHPVSSRMGKIHLPGVPVHSFFHTGHRCI